MRILAYIEPFKSFPKMIKLIPKIFAACALLATTSGCLRLDDNLYNPKKIDNYLLDAYTDERECADLSASYNIPANLVEVFTLPVGSAGEKIYAIYIGDQTRIGQDTVFMYCHGNKWHMDTYWNRAKLLANVGSKNRFGVLMLDYRGYGKSDGKTTESGMYEDVDACLAWLKMKGLTGDRLIMYGFSLGTASATELTANPRTLRPAKLILEAPFASAEVMVQDASRLALPSSFFTNLKIDNAEEIKKVSQPFLWLHGEADDFLSVTTHGQVVSENYKGARQTVKRVANAGHSNVPKIMGYENYSRMVLDFITLP